MAAARSPCLVLRAAELEQRLLVPRVPLQHLAVRAPRRRRSPSSSAGPGRWPGSRCRARAPSPGSLRYSASGIVPLLLRHQRFGGAQHRPAAASCPRRPVAPLTGTPTSTNWTIGLFVLERDPDADGRRLEARRARRDLPAGRRARPRMAHSPFWSARGRELVRDGGRGSRRGWSRALIGWPAMSFTVPVSRPIEQLRGGGQAPARERPRRPPNTRTRRGTRFTRTPFRVCASLPSAADAREAHVRRYLPRRPASLWPSSLRRPSPLAQTPATAARRAPRRGRATAAAARRPTAAPRWPTGRRRHRAGHRRQADSRAPSCSSGAGPDVLYQKAYGNRALVPQAEPMTLDTVFDMASVTKVVATTTSVMMLVEDGPHPAERPRGDVHPRLRPLRQGRHHHPPPADARVGPAARTSI